MRKKPFSIDQAAYANLLAGINNLHFTERKGNLSDFHLYSNDQWLADTAVIEQLTRSKGEWQVDLLFASIYNPLKFLKRHITSHVCPKRAAQQAHFMRRLAAKDQRGTLTVSADQLNPCLN
ncbi:hypothetical protein GGR92_000865 [Spirosoma lacussanchae]|uniref:Uncharacterized protein n=1 Tax=Spirosoma sordidisoli TaxID=2502893 RepID=A0A4Q2UPE7_9BACT|nr:MULTISPECIES: hypothetical protein [Spirosoma]RYC71226.1 hypothetical protein EQG79_03515 [Spirosoma sordidisoli]